MRYRLKPALAAVVLSLVVACGGAAADSGSSVVKEQDGIRAELSVIPTNVILRWRFLKWLSDPLDEVTATVNGRPLGVPTIERFPTSVQNTAIIELLDVSGLDRKDQIERLKMAMLRLAAGKAPHDQIAFAVYGLEAGLLAPATDEPEGMIKLLAEVPALDEIGNLSGALISAIRTLEKIPADRRAVYVFTDGHNDSDIPLARLEELARTVGTPVTFLVVPSGRSVEMPALAHLAQASGGQLVDESNIGSFLADPFRLLNSGAEVRFPLQAARRFFWEPKSDLNVAIRYGASRLEFHSDVPLPAASFNETATFVIEQHPAGAFAAGGGTVIAFLGLGFLAVRRRASRRRPIPEAAVICATLEDVDEGIEYPLTVPLTRIGRNEDNDIVLQAPTVGRFHAIVQQIGDAAYSITDQSSTNGTLVNNRKIDTSTLCDGDVISLGAKQLRFSIAQPGQPSRGGAQASRSNR
jgi:hypothetical protein